MAADVRISAMIKSELTGNFSLTTTTSNDGSEKLFALNYLAANNYNIKIGLCTSGFAGGHGTTIASILREFLSQTALRQENFNERSNL